MTTYRFSDDTAACNFAREHIASGIPATVTPQPWPGGDAVVTTGDALQDFARAVKQLCADFSDRQNRPYMGDVTAAIDALLAMHTKQDA